MPAARTVDWFDAEEVPRAGVSDTERLARRQRLYRVVVWAAIIAFPFAVLGVLIRVTSPTTRTVLSASSAGTGAVSPGKAVAYEELFAWLDQTPSPLPGGRVVSWDGAERVSPVRLPKGSADAGPAAPTEIDRFLVVSGAGTMYQADVEVVYGADGAYALGGPSLEPITAAPASAASGASPWPGVVPSTDVSSAVQAAINSWVTAYTSGSPEELRLSVGDPDGSVTFFPLSGIESASATATAVAPTGPAGSDEEMVEVTLAITWDGESTDQAVSGGGPATTMDLLVARASTAAPVVVAWGPAGSGPSLRPYQNAVPDGTTSAPASPPPATARTATSTAQRSTAPKTAKRTARKTTAAKKKG